MRLFAMFMSLALACAWGQEKKEITPAPAARQAKVFAVKNGDPDQIAGVLRSTGANVSVDRRLGMVIVSGEPSLLGSVTGIIQTLDVPAPKPKNIEITGYVIEAGTQAAESRALPADLEPVLRQLRETFGYQSFRVLDTPQVRSREGEGVNVEGILSTNRPYSLQFRPSFGGGRLIRLQDFRLRSIGNFPVNFSTNLELEEGQKVVVGKAGMDAERALVLVITGRILN